MHNVGIDDKNKTDIIKWAVGILFLIIAIGANIHYVDDYPILYRALGVCFLFLVSGFTLATTKHGKVFINYILMAKKELMKVVWPTRQETVQMTFMVIVVVIGVSCFLWLVDTVLLDVMQYTILQQLK